jgi:hypothetical protein
MATSENRWWEYYFLRYFVATVVGTVTIIILSKSLCWLRTDLGLPLIKDLSSVEIKEMPGWAALGFAYCYVASAPMLVWHATRAHLGLNPLLFRRAFWTLTAIGIASAFVLFAYCLSIVWWTQGGLGLLVLLIIVGPQVATIVAAHFNRFRAIAAFYRGLALDRANEKPSISQYVESYRHLREHGNAFSIVLLEFALLLVLRATPRPALALGALILWLLPSTYSWFIGSLLESKLHEVSLDA